MASEPVFSLENGVVYYSFRDVFDSGLDDPALLNAVMLTFAFAAAEGTIDQESLGYQSQAIGYIRERMSCTNKATSATTMGAILLLAGVEVRENIQVSQSLHVVVDTANN
jgi:hypothetical protein